MFSLILLIEEPRKLFEWDEFESGLKEAGFAVLEREQWYFAFLRSFGAEDWLGRNVGWIPPSSA